MRVMRFGEVHPGNGLLYSDGEVVVSVSEGGNDVSFNLTPDYAADLGKLLIRQSRVGRSLIAQAAREQGRSGLDG